MILNLGLLFGRAKLAKLAIINWVLNLNSTNYTILSEPVTLTGNFRIEGTFNTSVPVNSTDAAVFGNHTATVDYFQLQNSASNVDFTTSDGSVAVSKTDHLDGLDHSYYIDRTDSIVSIGIDYAEIASSDLGTISSVTIGLFGALYQSGIVNQQFIGNLPYLKIIDNATATPIVHSWKLNSGPPVYDVGSEQVANGDFDTDLTGWSSSINWVWSNGTARHQTGATNSLVQSNPPLVINDAYVIKYDVTGRTAGNIRARAGSGTSGAYNSTNDSFSEILVCSGNTDLLFTPSVDFDGSLDNISVKPLIDVISDGTLLEPSEQYGISADIMRADDWAIPTDASIITSGKTVTFDGTQAAWSGVKINQAEIYSGLHMMVLIVLGDTQGQAYITADTGTILDSGINILAINLDADDINIQDQGGNALRFDGSVEIISIKPVKEGLIYENVTPLDYSIDKDITLTGWTGEENCA